MFGTLRPNLCQLSREQGQAYRRMYCGTCKALGDHYGQLARPLLSYDIVLFASVIEALQPTAATTDSCRCPILPIVHRPTFSPDSPSMHVAAAVQVVLADQWLADQVQDGSRAIGLARPLLGMSARARRAADDLRDFGFDVQALTRMSESQLAVERETRHFARAAEPTAAVLQSMFGQLAELSQQPVLASALAQLGRHVGTAVYALDALDDLQDDLTRERFNPCLDRNGRISLIGLEQLASALKAALRGIEVAVMTIPWRRHRDIVHNVLCQRFATRCRRALARAREQAAAWQADPPRRPAWPLRPLLTLWAMLTAIWGMLSRRVRVVRHRRRRHRPPRRGTACEVADSGTACAPTPVLAGAGELTPMLSTGAGGGAGGDDDGAGHPGPPGSPPWPGTGQPDAPTPSGEPGAENTPAPSQTHGQAPGQSHGQPPGQTPTGQPGHGASPDQTDIPGDASPTPPIQLELATPEEQRQRQKSGRRRRRKQRKEDDKPHWWDDIICCCDVECCCDAGFCAAESEGSCCASGCCGAGCCEGVCGDASCDCCSCDCTP